MCLLRPGKHHRPLDSQLYLRCSQSYSILNVNFLYVLEGFFFWGGKRFISFKQLQVIFAIYCGILSCHWTRVSYFVKLIFLAIPISYCDREPPKLKKTKWWKNQCYNYGKLCPSWRTDFCTGRSKEWFWLCTLEKLAVCRHLIWNQLFSVIGFPYWKNVVSARYSFLLGKMIEVTLNKPPKFSVVNASS